MCMHPVAAVALGLVHRLVSIRQKQGQGGVRYVCVMHHADADGDPDGRPVVQRHFQRCDTAAQAFGDVVRALFRGVGQEQGEFLSAQAAEQVVGAHERADGVREDFQGLIASGMAVPVVQQLEVIEVQHQQGVALGRRRGPSQVLVGAAQKGRARQGVRQGVSGSVIADTDELVALTLAYQMLNDLTRSIDFALQNAERGATSAGAVDAGNANICQTRILTKGIEQLRELRDEVLRQRAQMRQSYMAALSTANLSVTYAGVIRQRDRDARDASGADASRNR